MPLLRYQISSKAIIPPTSKIPQMRMIVIQDPTVIPSPRSGKTFIPFSQGLVKEPRNSVLKSCMTHRGVTSHVEEGAQSCCGPGKECGCMRYLQALLVWGTLVCVGNVLPYSCTYIYICMYICTCIYICTGMYFYLLKYTIKGVWCELTSGRCLSFYEVGDKQGSFKLFFRE